MDSANLEIKAGHIEGVTYTVLTDGFSVYDEPRHISLRLQVVSQGARVTLNKSRAEQGSERCETVKKTQCEREKNE